MPAKRRFGALRKLPSGRWQVRYRNARGVLVAAPRTFTTKTDAARFLSSMEVDQLRGQWLDPAAGQHETLRSWADRWFEQHAPTLTPSTAASYRGLLDVCVLRRILDGRDMGLGTLPLAQVTPLRVGEWLADLQRAGLSASRVRKAYRVLSLAMDAAVRERLVQTNPCGRHQRLPRLPEHDPTILSVDQVEMLASHLRAGAPPRGKDRSGCQPIRPNPSLALLVELLAYGGLRVGEALALRRRHVDLLGGKVIVAESLSEISGVFTFGPTKTHQVREVPLPRSLMTVLEQHLDQEVEPTVDALVFTSATGGPVRYTSLRRSFDAACRRVGLQNVTPHSLRASCASWVAETDGVLEAARRLGHATTSITTRHYARPMRGGDRTVADRLDRARQAAKAAGAAPDVARTWHESPPEAPPDVAPKRAHPR